MNARERGRRELDRISDGTGDQIATRLERLSPSMADLLVSHGYGTVYAAPELSRQFREIATVAVLAAQGYRSELRIHLEASLRVGIDPAELVALAEHLSLYAGLPRMIEMADLLTEVLDGGPTPLFGTPVSLGDHETMVLDQGGDSPPLVLLHSVGTSRWTFRPFLSRLGDSFRGITYDLRGHGSAHAPAATVSIDSWVEDLRNLLDRMNLDRVHLAGLSLGGTVALCFADRYPDRLRSLRLLSPPPPDPEKYAARARLIRTEGPERQIGPTLSRWFTSPFLGENPWEVRICRENLRVVDPEVWAASFDALAGITPRPRPRFPFPVSFFGGEFDQSVSSDLVERFSSTVESASFRIVSGAPHQMALETPEALLSKFLAA